MKVADFAGDRRQVRLGQRPHHARALHRAHGGVTDGTPLSEAAVKPLSVTSGRPKAVNGLLLLKFTDRGAVVHAGAEIDAHLLDDVAPHFGDMTLSITWSRPRTTIELTTLSAPPTSRAAMSPACWASIGLDTEPVRIDAVADALDLHAGRSASARRGRR